MRCSGHREQILVPLKSGTPSLKRTMVFQISGSRPSTIMALWKRKRSDALSERTEFTLILLGMAAGDVSW